MRKTYGYLIHVLLEDMKCELLNHYQLWYKYKLEVADQELAAAYKSLSRDAGAAADNIAYILMTEGKMTADEYHAAKMNAMQNARKSLSIE